MAKGKALEGHCGATDWWSDIHRTVLYIDDEASFLADLWNIAEICPDGSRNEDMFNAAQRLGRRLQFHAEDLLDQLSQAEAKMLKAKPQPDVTDALTPEEKA